MIPQLNLLFADCTYIQIHGRVLSSLVGQGFPKPHERTGIVFRRDTDVLPLPGHRQSYSYPCAVYRLEKQRNTRHPGTRPQEHRQAVRRTHLNFCRRSRTFQVRAR
jgi:hypothetical protein